MKQFVQSQKDLWMLKDSRRGLDRELQLNSISKESPAVLSGVQQSEGSDLTSHT